VRFLLSLRNFIIKFKLAGYCAVAACYTLYMDNANPNSRGRDSIITALSACGAVRRGEPLSAHTSFRTGGAANIFAEPNSEDGLISALRILKRADVEPFILGNGTNVLFADEGFDGVIICIGAALSEINICGETLTVQAGARLSEIAGAAAKAELSGFEALSGIPGTVGGAVFMNAGAYGHEIKDTVVSVRAYDAALGEIREYDSGKLDLDYRSSRFQRGGEIILSAKFRLAHRAEDEIRADMSNYARLRREKQPIELPSAGSFFKRPEGYYAGALIEEAGLKGASEGGAQVSPKHAGFIVNTGGATTDDILRLMKRVQDTVRERSGIALEPEPRIVVG
jgi:UDP-N-acetylmuramate dehydrogenase